MSCRREGERGREREREGERGREREREGERETVEANWHVIMLAYLVIYTFSVFV